MAPISFQQRKHFIAIRALSNLANGGSADSMRLTLIIMVEMLNSQGQNYFDNFFKKYWVVRFW